MYDVVVVGARCAGAPLAMLLARAGRSVALVDRATFPSDTMSTHFVWPRGLAMLASWGLLDDLWARGCVAIPEITFDVGPVQLRGSGPPVDGVAVSCCPRRTVLDALLVDAAVAAGAQLLDDFVVDDVSWSMDRATGVVGHRPGASTRSAVTAGLVVGADGLRSVVADRVGAKPYRYVPPQTCVYYSYWSDIEDRTAAFHARRGRLVLEWPTNDDLTCVYVAWPAEDFARVRADVGGEFQAAVGRIPQLAERLAGGRRVAPFVGTRSLPNQYLASAGPGWALVGDAGHHKDPCTGMGISDAFASAALLAESLVNAAGDDRSQDQASVCYQQRRDAATANGFDLTLKSAQLPPLTPRLEAFYRTAAEQPRETERIFAVLAGTTPVAEVYGR
jgi:flavin-dependent dehydrogenase